MLKVFFEGKEFLGSKPQLSFIEVRVVSDDDAQRMLSEAYSSGFLRTRNEWIPFHRIRHIEKV